MTMSQVQASIEPPVNNARDLLVNLYRNIGISAVAAALEVSRQPSTLERKPEIKHEIPAILQDHDLAA